MVDTQKPTTTITLERRVGLLSATLIVIGNIIGVGIFFSTGVVSQYVNSPVELIGVWALGGLLSMAGAMSFAEIGATRPNTGGDYIYLREAYGPLVAFLSGWACFLITFSSGIAAMAVGFSEYCVPFIPFSAVNLPLGAKISAAQISAIFTVLFLSFINYLGITTGSLIQNIVTMVKAIAILLLICLAFSLGKGSFNHFSPFLLQKNQTLSLTGIGLALIPILFTYQGWNATTYIAGEIRNPEKNLPTSIIAGTSVTIFIYLLINMVYLYALKIEEMKGVVNIIEKASFKLFTPEISTWLTGIVALSIFGGLSTTILLGPRIYYAMAIDKLFFSSASKVNEKYGSPASAIAYQAIWSSVLVLIGGFEELLTYAVFASTLFSTLTVGSIFIFRKRAPLEKRPYSVWGYPYLPILFILSMILIMGNTLYNRPVESFLGLFVIGAGVPVYYFIKPSSEKEKIESIND